MSAAANAAGYLYAHGHLAASDVDAQVHAAKPAPSPEQSKPVAQVRAPRIEYRKRRLYAMPAAA